MVRPLGGANCSSVGSVVDLLFLTATAGGALLVAVSAALAPAKPAEPAPTEPAPPLDEDPP
ncbi:MAG: hypothetical protein MUF64_06465 [Polyangiaceae bacterium]|nr:hypothetical protein [Polyangiaceae bacterium]